MSVEETRVEPYMAMVHFSRRNGHKHLHDVDYPRDGYIVLTITEGMVKRSTTSDFHMAANRFPVVEVAMSELQFAQLISTMNIGDGVPGTFQYRPEPGTQSVWVEMPEAQKTTEQKFSDDVKATAKTAVDAQTEVTKMLRQLLAGKTINKGAVQAVLEQAEIAQRELSSSLPFILERADEDIGDRAARAKVEVAAFAKNIVQGLGMDALGERAALAGDQIVGHIAIEDQTKS